MPSVSGKGSVPDTVNLPDEAGTTTTTNCTCYPNAEFKCVPDACPLGGPLPAATLEACEALCLASAAKDPLNGCFAASLQSGTCQLQVRPPPGLHMQTRSGHAI